MRDILIKTKLFCSKMAYQQKGPQFKKCRWFQTK